MKVLFISKELNQTAGSGVGARMHLDSIRETVGEDNVHVMDMAVDVAPRKETRYIAFGKYPSKLNRIRRHLEGHSFYFSNKIISDIIAYIKVNKIDTVFLDDSYFGLLAKSIKKNCPGVRVIAFFHDVKAELFKIWMKRAKLIDKWDLSASIKNEEISTSCVDANVVLNKAENELLKSFYGKTADYYLPVCVEKNNSESFDDPFIDSGKKHIIFVGTKYLPNMNAVRWFSKEVLPQIRQYYDLWILGKGLECLREEIHDEDVHIIGFAESLVPYYQYSDVVIAPLVDGGGMKIKTAEAFSYGKVFVGSSESLHGYYDNLSDELKNAVVFCCDSKNDYIEAFTKLSSTDIQKENAELVNVYEKYYSPKAAQNIMEKILFNR